MPSLKELLDDIKIDVDDLDKKDDEIDISKIKLDDIPEEQRGIFKKALDIISEQTNAIATRDIMLRTMKETIGKTKEPEPKKDEKILGVLDENDPYAPAFKTLSDKIDGLISKTTQREEKSFEQRVTEFAKENKDIVRYAQDMDRLLKEHPSLANDIPKLYLLAKSTTERRGEKETVKEKETTGFRFDTGGPSPSNVTDLKNYKTIGEAFDAALNKK